MRRLFTPRAATVTTVVRGPEPVGAAAIGGLDTVLGRMLSGSTGAHIPYGNGASKDVLWLGESGHHGPDVAGAAALSGANLRLSPNELPATHRAVGAEASQPSPMYDLLSGMSQ